MDWGGGIGFYDTGFEWVGGSPPSSTDTAQFSPSDLFIPAGVSWRDATGNTASGRVLVEQGQTQFSYAGSATGGSFTHTATTQVGSLPDIEIFNSGELLLVGAPGTLNLTTPGRVELSTGGRLTVLSANSVTANDLDLFGGFNETNSVNVEGAGSNLNVAATTRIVGGTEASISLANGANASLGSLELLSGGFSSSEAVFSVGSGSIATIDGFFEIGADATSPSSGSTTLNVTGFDSEVTVTGATTSTVGSANGSGATLNVLSGGQLDVSPSGGLLVNAGGTVNLNDAVIDLNSGDLTIDGGSYLQTGAAATLGNTANTTHVLNGGLLDLSPDLYVYQNGATVRASSGGTIRTAGAIVGVSNSPAPQVIVDGGLYETDGEFSVGTGSVTLSSGQIKAQSFSLSPLGSMDHSSGTLTVDGGTFSLPAETTDFVVDSPADGDRVVELVNGASAVTGEVGINTGTIRVSGAGSSWTSSETVRVGDRTGRTGVLELTNGASLISQGARIGRELGAIGDVTIDASVWTVDGPVLKVGDLGSALLEVTNGGSLVSNGATSPYAASGSAAIDVNGAGSEWINTGDLELGVFGPSQLVASSDGVVSTTGTLTLGTSGTLRIDGGRVVVGSLSDVDGGTLDHRTGELVIDGGSFDVAGILRVDGGGAASDQPVLTWTNGATSSLPQQLIIGTQAGAVVNILEGSQVTTAPNDINGRVLIGASEGGGIINVNGSGSLLAAGQRLEFRDSSTLSIADGGQATAQEDLQLGGELFLDAGSVEVGDDVRIETTGSVTGNGTITAAAEISNAGRIVPGFGVGSGPDLTFEGEFTQTGTGVLEIAFDGGTTGEYISVQGTATLNGRLDITSGDPSALGLGERATILSATGGISGGFGEINLDVLPLPLVLSVVQTANEVTVVVAPALDGDFNADGVVDAADFTVWRDNLGSNTALAADANLDSLVSIADYEVWRANYGNSLALDAAAVPEPTTAGAAVFALTLFIQHRRRRTAAGSCRSELV